MAIPTRVFRMVVLPWGVQDLPHVRTAGDGHAAAPRPRARSLPQRLAKSGIETLAAARARRILDVLDLVERDVDDLAADLLHPPDIDRLHHIAGIGVN